jgi:hypothetical protein
MAFLIGMGIVTIMGFSQGDPNLVLYPYDEDGNQCGRSKLVEYPYLYLYAASSNLKEFDLGKVAQGICLTSCPTNYTGILPCYPTSKNPACTIKSDDFYVSTSCMHI